MFELSVEFVLDRNLVEVSHDIETLMPTGTAVGAGTFFAQPPVRDMQFEFETEAAAREHEQKFLRWAKSQNLKGMSTSVQELRDLN